MALPTVSSNLSTAELVAIYRDMSDYDLVESTERAKRFVQAARCLLAIPVRRSSDGGGPGSGELELAPEMIREAERQALTWLRLKNVQDADLTVLSPDPDWRDC